MGLWELPVQSLVIICIASVLKLVLSTNLPPCDNKIYCHGSLLHTVQMSHVYHDDKTFVDKPLKFAPTEILHNFTHFMKEHGHKPNKNDLLVFLEDNFYPNGHELMDWIPDDWHENPKFLSDISDEKLRNWAKTLHEFWKRLGKTIREDCKLKPDRHSLIYVSQPFIIPGGRFREFYYWDSYWIQRGLLQSEMYGTVRGMIQNFLELVEKMGFVPNGGRIYYLRSQPPLLISMMKSYYKATRDIDFLRSSLPILEKEFKFWLKNRMVSIYHKGKKYRVARYSSDRTGPRPEAYSIDYELAESLPSQKLKNDLYTHLQGAAESGWDFSSRWFFPEQMKRKGNRSDTGTRFILPVDLNAILFFNAKTLSEFLALIGGSAQKINAYEKVSDEFHRTVQDIFWDEELGTYFDYDMIKLHRNKEFFPSMLVPLWLGVDSSPRTVSRILDYFDSVNVFKFLGGLPTSLYYTGEQWDLPNGWSPLNHIAIEAFANSGFEKAETVAYNLAAKWIASNYQAFYGAVPNTMFEKYDVTKFGSPGSGGEYSVVAGFGWTNGVVLDLLAAYGQVFNITEILEDIAQHTQDSINLIE